jgi:hypothetical protein
MAAHFAARRVKRAKWFVTERPAGHAADPASLPDLRREFIR